MTHINTSRCYPIFPLLHNNPLSLFLLTSTTAIPPTNQQLSPVHNITASFTPSQPTSNSAYDIQYPSFLTDPALLAPT